MVRAFAGDSTITRCRPPLTLLYPSSPRCVAARPPWPVAEVRCPGARSAPGDCSRYTLDSGASSQCGVRRVSTSASHPHTPPPITAARSEEHTSELQSRFDLVCRLLLEKKKNNYEFNFNSSLCLQR